MSRGRLIRRTPLVRWSPYQNTSKAWCRPQLWLWVHLEAKIRFCDSSFSVERHTRGTRGGGVIVSPSSSPNLYADSLLLIVTNSLSTTYLPTYLPHHLRLYFVERRRIREKDVPMISPEGNRYISRRSYQAYDLLSPGRTRLGVGAEVDVVVPCLECFDQLIDPVFLRGVINPITFDHRRGTRYGIQ